MADKVQHSAKNETEKSDSSGNDQLPKQKSSNEDPELDDLLDSALEDFDKTVPKPVEDVPNKGSDAEAEKLVQPQMPMPPEMAMFEQMFNAEAMGGVDLQQHFAEAMQSMMGEDPDMMKNMQNLTEAAGKVDDSAESQKEFADTLHATLAGLSQNAESIQGEFGDDELMRAMSNLGMEDGLGEGDLDFMPMMQGMMKSLLSKEVLYPSLKDISQKYPAWLSEHKDSLKSEDFNNYTSQHGIMLQICSLFEEEKDDDPQDVKQHRFQKILDLMQRMQDMGQPPKEIVGEMMPGVEFDEQGNPRLPNMGEQCSIM